MKQYYSLATAGSTADIYIFDDIVTPDEKAWREFWGDTAPTSGLSLVQDLAGLDAETINVHINSYGGVVSEGLAIYNTLRSHKAKVRTICEGFACSAASVVFMAGDERVMHPASLLMIHNTWVGNASGNAEQLRKQAEDLDIINSRLVEAYMSRVTIGKDELQALLDGESWIKPEDAVKMGFATEIAGAEESDAPAASARMAVFARITDNLVAAKIDVNVMDIPEMQKALADMQAKIDLLAAAPTKEPPAPEEKKVGKFLTALMGRKEDDND